MWVDPTDTGGEANPHGYATWIDQEGCTRYDGWRHLREVVDSRYEDGSTRQTHDEPEGPFWTDLFLCDEETHGEHP
jgi:hypothetical protein